jgi:energy-coupling factor transporter ATP-binding protein EcfA2
MTNEAKTSFEFTPSQKIADQKIREFLLSPVTDFDSKVLVLIGPAGSGKSTILKYSLSRYLKQDLENDEYNEDNFGQGFGEYIPNVFGVTVSHKAKQVLKRSIPNCGTYVNYYGLSADYSRGDGSVKFVKKPRNPNNPKIPPHELPFQVVVHDEVSMHSMKDIHNLEMYTHPSSKVILVGDVNQLPPIVERGEFVSDMDSPIFTYFDNVTELIEPVRQTLGNPILEIAREIIKEIKGNKNFDRILKLIKTDKFADGIGHRYIKRTQLIPDFTDEYKANNDTRVIAYYNKTVDRINKSIRKKMFSNADDKLVSGDAIYMNDSYESPINKDNFFNSEEFIISNLSTCSVSQYNLLCYKVNVDPLRPEGINIIHESNEAKFKKILKEKKDALRASVGQQRYFKGKEYSEFKRSFGDVSYGYCFTAYKAQGSGFKNVYVDILDIETSSLTNKRKLQTLYTSITRATHQVIFF